MERKIKFIINSPVEISETIIKNSVITNLKKYKFQNLENDINIYTFKNSDYEIIYEVKSYPHIKNYTIDIIIKYKENINDENLEGIKFSIKDYFFKELKELKCYWIRDTQTEKISQELYIQFHRIENMARVFINEIMIKSKGVNWWEYSLKKDLKNKIEMNTKSMRKILEFNNIEKVMFGIDPADIFKILQIQIKEINEKTDVCDSIEKIKKNISQYSNIEMMKKEMIELLNLFKIETKENFWDIYFSDYLDKEFKKKWNDFIKNRNDVMHNKPLTLNAKKKIQQNIKDIEEKLQNGKIKFEKNFTSVEESEIEELEKEFMASEKSDYDTMIYNDTGISITEEKIIDSYKSYLFKIFEKINDIIYYYNDLEIDYDIFSNPFLEITSLSKEINNTLRIEVKNWEINTTYGGVSNCVVIVKKNGSIIENFEIEQENPNYEFLEEQGYHMLSSFGGILVYENAELEFINIIQKLIKENFDNLENKTENRGEKV